jgi:NADH:ubiquinone oxidoreductase subunit E
MTPAQVRGVVTFYNFFRTEKTGHHVISVCTGTACHVKGAERVLDVLSELLGVKPGGTTEDGKFTVQAVRCIGACGLAPAMMVDDEVYGKLNRKRITDILDNTTP